MSKYIFANMVDKPIGELIQGDIGPFVVSFMFTKAFHICGFESEECRGALQAPKEATKRQTLKQFMFKESQSIKTFLSRNFEFIVTWALSFTFVLRYHVFDAAGVAEPHRLKFSLLIRASTITCSQKLSRAWLLEQNVATYYYRNTYTVITGRICVSYVVFRGMYNSVSSVPNIHSVQSTSRHESIPSFPRRKFCVLRYPFLRYPVLSNP